MKMTILPHGSLDIRPTTGMVDLAADDHPCDYTIGSSQEHLKAREKKTRHRADPIVKIKNNGPGTLTVSYV